MRKRILIAVVGGPTPLSNEEMQGLNNVLKSLDMAAIMLDEYPGPPQPTRYEVQLPPLPPPIEPCYCFVNRDNHKNQHWAKRNKNRKC